jgi:putative transposase
MPRQARAAPAGLIYHVLNRAAGRMKMFRRDSDFHAFERVLHEAHQRHPLRILSYCVMPSHWHFVVWPQTDDQVTNFFRWLAHTHAMRWRVSHHTVGYGHLYQGRFKSFPVQNDQHLLTLCRYVERNPLAAKLVKRAEHWPWSSLWRRQNGDENQNTLLTAWPVNRPRDWTQIVNEPMSDGETSQIKTSLIRNRPMGTPAWIKKTASRLHLDHTLRNEGRPQKSKKDKN